MTDPFDTKVAEWLKITNYDRITWEYEKKMWTLTAKADHPEHFHYLEIEGEFEKADDLEETVTCCHTTAGMLREFFCGEVKWKVWKPDVKTIPPILNVLYVSVTGEGKDASFGPTHELVIIRHPTPGYVYVVQSNYEEYRQCRMKYKWADISPHLMNPKILPKLVTPGWNKMEVDIIRITAPTNEPGYSGSAITEAGRCAVKDTLPLPVE